MKEDSLVKPTPLRGVTSNRSLLIPFDSASSVMKRRLDSIALNNFRAEGNLFYLLPNYTVLYGCIGASNTVLALERLIASGTDEVILLGVCGSLDSNIRMFEAVVIREAFVEEGTSRHYIPSQERFIPSEPLTGDIEAKLSKRDLPYRPGSIVSTDAPYRETKLWLEAKQKRGIQTVDMETSAVFSVCEFHGIRAASLQIISDVLYTGEWKAGFRHKELRQAMETFFFPFLTLER